MIDQMVTGSSGSNRHEVVAIRALYLQFVCCHLPNRNLTPFLTNERASGPHELLANENQTGKSEFVPLREQGRAVQCHDHPWDAAAWTNTDNTGHRRCPQNQKGDTLIRLAKVEHQDTLPRTRR
jgi:hypothetical protein